MKALLVYPLFFGLPLGVVIAQPSTVEHPSAAISPGSLPRVGSVDERFQSYNIEMVEVTGGRFWKPYGSTEPVKTGEHGTTGANQPAGMSPSLYEYRAPIDLGNSRLRRLAAALGPAYVRVSGTWANTTFFQDSDGPVPASPPAGFKGVLTRAQWKGVIDFASATDAQLVTSFAVSAGVRDEAGVWTPGQAESLLGFTKAEGGHIAAAEFMNEPTFASIGGAPAGYDAKAFARDLAVFEKFIRSQSPHTLLLGPGGVGEGGVNLAPPNMHLLSSADILSTTGPVFDAISFHSYAGVSSRCGGTGGPGTTTPEAALSADWLSRASKIETYYAALRDRFEPGKPMWNTETSQAACGGDRWASTFLDAFRYLNELGISAREGVQVHMHNTLAASDYGWLDEKTYEPRPDYWAALLWRRLMGTTVLAPGPASSPDLYLYAQCLRGNSGGVTVLAINANRSATASLSTPLEAEKYTLTAKDLNSQQVSLNDTVLELGAGDALPNLRAQTLKAGEMRLAPASITFLAFPAAENPACR